MEFGFLQQATDTANRTIYTFASQNLGTADADRYIIVGIQSRLSAGPHTVSSVTVGGVSATPVVTADRGTNSRGSIYIAAVPTGTTGDVVVTLSTGILRCGIALWRAVGIDSATPTDTETSVAETNDPAGSIDVPAGGFAVGVGLTNALTTATWTGLNEDSDTQAEITMTAGSQEFVSAQTGLTLLIDFAAATTDSIGVWAAWAPAAGGGSFIDNTTPILAHIGGGLI